MSTSCIIGFKVNEKVESIYVHWDGYPRGKNSVGQILKDHYTESKKILQLMELGNLSALGKEPVEDLDGWNPLSAFSFDHSKCLAYRTRGDTGVDKIINESEADYLNYVKRCDIDFAYLYNEGEWQILTKDNKFKKF